MILVGLLAVYKYTQPSSFFNFTYPLSSEVYHVCLLFHGFSWVPKFACTALIEGYNMNSVFFSLCLQLFFVFSLLHSFNNLIFFFLCTAPLDPNPTSEMDKIINDLRLQYRTYCVDFHAHEVSTSVQHIVPV